MDGLRLFIQTTLITIILSTFTLSCETARPKQFLGTVRLPVLRASADECYYIDDFLPTPDHLVTGRSGGLYLRYYTYRKALYKIWVQEDIELSFYSYDNECWSLFAENIIELP